MEQLSHDESLKVLEEAPVAHIGMIDEGRPYVTPMSFVVSENRILFRTMPGRKLDALRETPEVCIEVSIYDDDSGEWASVIVNGRASIVEDANTRSEMIGRLFRKYEKVMGSPLSRGGGLQSLPTDPHVVEVPIEEVSGMASGKGWSRRTRPGRL